MDPPPTRVSSVSGPTVHSRTSFHIQRQCQVSYGFHCQVGKGTEFFKLLISSLVVYGVLIGPHFACKKKALVQPQSPIVISFISPHQPSSAPTSPVQAMRSPLHTTM
ncbi:hypothetical protein BGZ61DRAFT_452260 [Ilyonectria robusta]|uniref:uncharacterized protein n=1 Tax=Ilyonectria robusta TaxID=1079257 RepID=UPI001E8E66F3|nr:uncharacterized protein BGZ61DRAFT_452260 [Ilyonectria robusta]KAH8694654.1 hypothetical protein BGZ61DRAFT_452260 [Ilyonectria robusta]